MSDYSAFFAFARERHRVYLRRFEQKLPEPWTDDPILQTYRFTNVYRELDVVTKWFRENVREKHDHDDLSAMMAVVAFRLFNRVPSGECIFTQTLVGGFTPFELMLDQGMTDDVMGVWRGALRSYLGNFGPFVTGSYIVNSPNGMSKLDGVLTMIRWVWERRDEFLGEIRAKPTLEHAWSQFVKVNHIAAFTSYEFVTDLRHSRLLRDAPDVDTWANAGPGAMRGLNRIHGRKLEQRQPSHVWVVEMRDLLRASRSRDDCVWPTNWPKLEMREIEHTLCEFDKYERARLGEGTPRQKFRPGRGLT